MTIRPTKLSLADDLLRIEWSDNQTLVCDIGLLRRECPCATCATARKADEEGAKPSVCPPAVIKQMSPVGNYAYNIVFADGHSTGIYPLETLRELGRPE